jgi:TrpR family transcriptional regulator, trp operon repressor
LEDPKKLDNLFGLFFTFEERRTLASRYLIIRALLEGQLTQREIAEKYKLSIAQITRGSNALKMLDPKFKKFLEKMLIEGI